MRAQTDVLRRGYMVHHIDTIEQFHAYRATVTPVYITSRTKGKILVPCMNTVLVATALVVNNVYNPNTVSPDKLEVLCTSIIDNGFCFPIVVIFDDETGLFVVIDGAHRRLILGSEWLDCDYLPLVVLNHDMSHRLTATWQFNKARGVHQVDLDAELIRRLGEQGLTDEQIAERLGIEVDTVFRYRQVAGIAEVIGAKAQWSMAWEMRDDDA